jgi:hypothetical protein
LSRRGPLALALTLAASPSLLLAEQLLDYDVVDCEM